MKIICTVINDLTYDQRMHRICTSLQKNGHEVTLIGRKLTSSKPLDNHVFKQRRVRCRFNSGKLFYLEYNFRLWWILLFSSFDVIYSVDLDTILPGYSISKLRKKTCVYDAHEYFSEVPEVVNRRLPKMIWEKVAQFVIPKIKYAYTVSQSLAEELTKRYDTDFGVIRNMPLKYKSIEERDWLSVQKKWNFNLEILKREKQTILLYQGALNDGRGIEQVFQAISKIENVELWLAGEGDLSQSLRLLAQELRVKDKVRFLGFVQPADLKILTRMADIGLNLLENKGKSYYFSLANKTFDYVQAEIPALHSNFPEYEYLNSQSEIGILIPDLSIEKIIIAIEKLIVDKDFYKKLKNNCQQVKEEWIWENEEQRLLEVYKKIERDLNLVTEKK